MRLPNVFRTAGLAVSAMVLPVAAATVEGTYIFNNNLNAQQGGAPALTQVDPGMVAGFTTDTVFGSSKTVYSWGGSALPPTSQGGLTLNTTGLLPSTTSYSVEMVFEFSQSANAWRRILDISNRQSDSGFYVDPSNLLDVFPVGSGVTTFTNNAYHYVVLTDSSGTAKGYLDGSLQFTLASAGMDNTNNLLTLFLDNTVGGGQGEWSPGRISLLRVSDGVLSDSDVANNFRALEGGSGVPEPASCGLMAIGLAGILLLQRRRR